MGDWGREEWGGWSFARGLGGGIGGGGRGGRLMSGLGGLEWRFRCGLRVVF